MLIAQILADIAQTVKDIDLPTVLGGGGVGAAATYYITRKIKVSNDPLNVRESKECATKEDLHRLTADIRVEMKRIEDRLQNVESTQREDINNVYNRINDQGEVLSEVLGLLKGIDMRLNPKPARSR